ncbi:hypothetical protein GIB67_016992 [Kingdonia uniflora]|uniref:Uncharacterized protein n=1 Tax=Kingdonia uniflora TaxID=39325 RepID=A0A7J7M3T2_9MAGN|nr:hypothetical protein GIB67_016992 [Kingdonia uniflora]
MILRSGRNTDERPYDKFEESKKKNDEAEVRREWLKNNCRMIREGVYELPAYVTTGPGVFSVRLGGFYPKSRYIYVSITLSSCFLSYLPCTH